jgi:hypothetical protein
MVNKVTMLPRGRRSRGIVPTAELGFCEFGGWFAPSPVPDPPVVVLGVAAGDVTEPLASVAS